MKVPGRAWLQFEISAAEAGAGSIVSQAAIFDLAGLFGLVYWYALCPFHGFIFGGVLEELAASSVARNRHRKGTDTPRLPL